MARVEIVEWDDAHVETGPKNIKELEGTKPVRTLTVGFVAAENQHGVVLATDIYPESPDEVHTPMFIPHGMIVKRTALDVDSDTVASTDAPPARQRGRRQGAKPGSPKK